MSDNEELEKRSRLLKSKIQKHLEKDEDTSSEDRKAGYQAYNEGFRLVIEFTTAILVGGALGYFIDTNFRTLPGGLIIGIILGFVTGVYNLMRYGNDKALEQSSTVSNEDKN